jgi:hypothetical protein
MIRAFVGGLWSLLGSLLRLIPGSSFIGTLWGKTGALLRRHRVFPRSIEVGGQVVFWLFIAVIATALLLNLIGCTSAGKQANAISQNIHGQTAEIVKNVNAAQTNIESADQKVLAATTQPSNPPATVDLLQGAHEDLTNAKSDLEPIVPATVAIDKKATEAAVLTNKVEKKLEAERASFFSYKQRWILGILAVLAPIAGVLIFIVKTNGGGPILAAIGSLIGPVFSLVWGVIKFFLKAVYHVLTFGLAKFADLVNHHYDQQQAAKKPQYESTGVQLADIARPGTTVAEKEPLG